jgi:hypothetical protein
MAWSPGEQAMAEHAVYDGIEMSPGVSVAGPSLIELGVTTILVPREYVARVDPGGAFILNLHAESARVAEVTADAVQAFLPLQGSRPQPPLLGSYTLYGNKLTSPSSLQLRCHISWRPRDGGV